MTSFLLTARIRLRVPYLINVFLLFYKEKSIFAAETKMSYILVFCIPLGDALSLSKMNASLGRKIAIQTTVFML